MSPRFRSITPDDERRHEDDISIDLDRLESELDETIARFDDASRGYLPPKDVDSNDPLSTFPPLDLPEPATRRSGERPAPPPAAVPAVTPKPAAVTPTPVPPPPAPEATTPGGGLLAELRQAAAQQSTVDLAQEQARKARGERCENAMRRLLKYLSEFARHLDTLRPSVPQTFRPLPAIDLSALCWWESFVDYRTRGGTETSPLDSLSLRYTLSAGDNVHIVKLPNHAPVFLEELKRVGLSFTATEKRGARGLVAEVDFVVDRAINVNLLFKIDTDRETVSLRTRNFTGLGNAAFTLKVADIDPALLDELGRQILGRPNRFFQRIERDAQDGPRS